MIDCRYIGADVLVLEVTPGTQVAEVITRLAGSHTFNALTDAFLQGVVGASVNGHSVNLYEQLLPDADVFSFQEGAGHSVHEPRSPVFVATTEPFDVVLQPRPPTPPVPERHTVVPRRWKRHGVVSSAE